MSLNTQSRADDQGGGRVFDVADPDRHGKVIKAGPELSEVRWDDGAERIVSNVHLRAVETIDTKKSADGLCEHNPSLSVSEVVRLGQEAMQRKRRSWDDWLLIAEALQAGRTEVTRELHTNETRGRRFEKAMGDWLIAHSFKEIDKGARSRLLDCLKHKAEIQAWRARLTDSERWKFNHPDTVLRKWKASIAVPDPNKAPKPSPYQKLQADHMALIEERDRYKREIDNGGGDLWNSDDRPRDIARIVIQQCKSKTKAEKVAREILKALKAKKQPA
jgi:hypothetical protein